MIGFHYRIAFAAAAMAASVGVSSAGPVCDFMGDYYAELRSPGAIEQLERLSEAERTARKVDRLRRLDAALSVDETSQCLKAALHLKFLTARALGENELAATICDRLASLWRGHAREVSYLVSSAQVRTKMDGFEDDPRTRSAIREAVFRAVDIQETSRGSATHVKTGAAFLAGFVADYVEKRTPADQAGLFDDAEMLEILERVDDVVAVDLPPGASALFPDADRYQLQLARLKWSARSLSEADFMQRVRRVASDGESLSISLISDLVFGGVSAHRDALLETAVLSPLKANDDPEAYEKLVRTFIEESVQPGTEIELWARTQLFRQVDAHPDRERYLDTLSNTALELLNGRFRGLDAYEPGFWRAELARIGSERERAFAKLAPAPPPSDASTLPTNP